MKKQIPLGLFAGIILLFTIVFSPLHAQSPVCRDSLLNAARELMKAAPYCALVTVDSTGQPQIRTMNPFPQSEGFVIWFATSRYSAKVREMRNNPKVSVYYADHVKAKGYVAIEGKAEVIDDPELLVKMKRDYWDHISGWKENFVLIKIVPRKLEVINYKHGLNNEAKTLQAPSLVF